MSASTSCLRSQNFAKMETCHCRRSMNCWRKPGSRMGTFAQARSWAFVWQCSGVPAWGKMAATFVDLETHRAIRIAARESSKDLARQLHPELENKNLQQMAAYREMSDQDLFDQQWVQVALDAKEFPGYKGERVACARCGEGINYDRFLVRDGETLCLSCAEPEQR